MACSHVNAPQLHPPGASESVYREDCTQCFDSIDDPTGLDVCLYCFNGGCTGRYNHSKSHFISTGHPLALNIRRTKKPVNRDEPPQKISKLAIAAETEEDKYDTKSFVKCFQDEADNVDTSAGEISKVVQGVLKATTYAKQQEVKAWEQEMVPCEHTLCLTQEASRKIESQDLGHCSACEINQNLWLCLTCGNLGCGRAQFGGVGGNSHGLAHYDSRGHPVAVKLGSITPEGTADVYCYDCNEERIDTELGQHLAHWGINLAEREKTEKSLGELQIEQNLRWDFLTTTEDGKELQPLFGPGFTGLKNLGNSCYLNSTVQCLFSLNMFIGRYNTPPEEPPATDHPADDLETQLRKLAHGLLSRRYSKPDSDVIASEYSPEIPHQKGLAPSMFKHLIGRGHEEFSTMRQQDAFELLLHLFKLITRSTKSGWQDPTVSFRFAMEQRLQCVSCKKVRYKTDEQDNITVTVPVRRKPRAQDMDVEEVKDKPKDEFESIALKECLDIFTGSTIVEYTCPSCGSKDGFTKRSLFKTFPTYLVVCAYRFETINWVPTKLDIPVLVGDESFSMGDYLSQGHQPDEELLPEDVTPVTSTAFVPNEGALSQLEAMGFPRVRCEKALHATGNSDAEAAMQWPFSHMEDADIDDPVQLTNPNAPSGGSSSSTPISQESIELMSAMGISAPQARKALRETGGDVERAVDWVFSHPDDQGDFGNDEEQPPAVNTSSGEESSEVKLPGSPSPSTFRLASIVCHKGASVHAGHYVAFVRKDIPGADHRSVEKDVWVLFNDEKVVRAVDVDDMKKFAYVYFFQRVAD